ncbi:MAG: HAMP domain-containing histidine kinase [Proteobacteria bacterium]|nr:HAMP domain-containing histidine kinase [Pseudomonadota bacterium]
MLKRFKRAPAGPALDPAVPGESLSVKIKSALRSFSFRVGVLFFVALCTTLIVLRVHIYYQSVSTAYEDIRAIVNAHAEEISQGIDKYGISYVHYLVKAMIEDTQDKHLYLVFREGKHLSGNLSPWPSEINLKLHWQEISIPQDDEKPPLHLLVKATSYKNNGALLIGYDLQRVDFLRDTLLRVAIANILLSLLMSFSLSILVVWLVNRHLQFINRACERVMRGQLQYRVLVRGANDQFDKLGANINSMLDWIATLLGTVRDSTNAIAHDMRTPLSRHRIELQALIDDPGISPAVREKIGAAVMRVDGIVEMFDNILSIAKAESRTGTELFVEINMNEIVEDVIEFYAALLEEQRQQLTVDIPLTPLWMTGDKQLISQAVVNLVDNAVKYTPEGGHIRVSLRAEGSFIIATVSDNGPGIPKQFMNQAKERFFRVDESRNTPGTGLGLSLVNAVATLHHGTLTLTDNDPGLCATLRLSRNIEVG